MRYLIYLLAILFLLALNFGLFSYLKIFGVAPNLLFLFLICLAVEKQNFDFIFVALVGGLFLDFYNGVLPGSFVLGFFMVGFLLQLVINTFVVEELKWQKLIIVVAVSVITLSLIVWGYGLVGGLFRLRGAVFGWTAVRRSAPWSVIYNAALFYPVYFFSTVIRNWILELEYHSRRRN